MLHRLFTVAGLLALAACASAPPRVRVAVSVDWEGRALAAINLRAFEAFRKAHPDVPLTHFLNAAYFTKADADPAAVAQQVRSVLAPQDELGLHIHPWKSLVEAAGVSFRSTPTIWGPEYPPRPGRGDSGHDVSVEAYAMEEFRAVVRKAKELLAAHGLAPGPSFRAGAWLAGPRVHEAIRREGFEVDSSATDTGWHDEIARTALPGMIRALWPEVTRHTQPFWIDTPAGPLMEMPDTGALADYVTADEMADHVADAVARLAGGGGDRFVHVGFHLETAARFLPRVTTALRRIKDTHGDRVVFETLGASARRAREVTGPRR